jgi:uncharacterized protein (UPF0332 family)
VDEATAAIVQIRLERADEELHATRELIRNGFYRIACSRAYYAAFLMTTAALLTLGVTRGKHSGVEAGLHELLVKADLLELEYGKLYVLLRKDREDSDYNDMSRVTKEMACQRLVDAERYVARLSRYLHEVGAA